MKDSGVDGRKIVSSIVDNSATFSSKTEFSQEKYLKRKKNKLSLLCVARAVIVIKCRYLPSLQVLKPTARTVFTSYYSYSPTKLHFMRPEAAAYLLTTTNVRAGAAVVVVGDRLGALCGAVLERLRDDERVLLLHGCKRMNSLPALRHWGAGVAARVTYAPIGSATARQWCEARGGADALLLAGKLDPRLVLPAVLSLLSPSSPFAVFSPYVDVRTVCWWPGVGVCVCV
jgi:hypothetical protein